MHGVSKETKIFRGRSIREEDTEWAEAGAVSAQPEKVLS